MDAGVWSEDGPLEGPVVSLAAYRKRRERESWKWKDTVSNAAHTAEGNTQPSISRVAQKAAERAHAAITPWQTDEADIPMEVLDILQEETKNTIREIIWQVLVFQRQVSHTSDDKALFDICFERAWTECSSIFECDRNDKAVWISSRTQVLFAEARKPKAVEQSWT